MPISIKNPEVEQLARQVTSITGETMTEAIRVSLTERRARLTRGQSSESRLAHLLDYLEVEVWPLIPKSELGRELSRDEEDEILGYGPAGV